MNTKQKLSLDLIAMGHKLKNLFTCVSDKVALFIKISTRNFFVYQKVIS